MQDDIKVAHPSRIDGDFRRPFVLEIEEVPRWKQVRDSTAGLSHFEFGFGHEFVGQGSLDQTMELNVTSRPSDRLTFVHGGFQAARSKGRPGDANREHGESDVNDEACMLPPPGKE
jgi:hypothetical protein